MLPDPSQIMIAAGPGIAVFGRSSKPGFKDTPHRWNFGKNSENRLSSADPDLTETIYE
jgi:hypothetical protein